MRWAGMRFVQQVLDRLIQDQVPADQMEVDRSMKQKAELMEAQAQGRQGQRWVEKGGVGQQGQEQASA